MVTDIKQEGDYMPHKMNIRIDDKLWNGMKEYPGINWNEVMIEGIRNKLKNL